MKAIGLGGMDEEPVRVRLGENRAEVVVAGREVAGQGAGERPVGLGVEADGIGVVVAPGEVVHGPAVELVAPALVGVVGVGMGTAHGIGEMGVGVQRAVGVGVLQRRRVLHAVGAGEPAEEVVEAPVLHHHHDHVLDARPARVGEERRQRP